MYIDRIPGYIDVCIYVYFSTIYNICAHTHTHTHTHTHAHTYIHMYTCVHICTYTAYLARLPKGRRRGDHVTADEGGGVVAEQPRPAQGLGIGLRHRA